jgi:hypothetical protein
MLAFFTGTKSALAYVVNLLEHNLTGGQRGVGVTIGTTTRRCIDVTAVDMRNDLLGLCDESTTLARRRHHSITLLNLGYLATGATLCVPPLPVSYHGCRGSLPPTVNLYRSCVGLGWLAQETMGFILVRASEE